MMLIATSDHERAMHLNEACQGHLRFFDPQAEQSHVSEFLQMLQTERIGTVIIGPGYTNDFAIKLTTAVRQTFPSIGILTFVSGTRNDIRAAFTAGATDVVSPTANDLVVAELIFYIQERAGSRTVATAPPPPPPATAEEDATTEAETPDNLVATVLSQRGGVGRTLVATGLAMTMERHYPGEVVVVDLDLQNGDVAPALGVTAPLSIASLANREATLDLDEVLSTLIQNESGVQVLAAPPNVAGSIDVTPELVAAVIDQLQQRFAFVVIDTGSVLTEPTLAAIDNSTDLLLLTAPDVPSVRALSRLSDTLSDLRITEPTRHLVVNKATDRYGMPLRDIESVSGMNAAAEIPAAKEIAVALNRGASIAQAITVRGSAQRALNNLAHAVTPEVPAAKKRRMWSTR